MTISAPLQSALTPGDAPPIGDEIDGLRLHQEFERWEGLPFGRQEIQKIPLGHHRDVGRLDGQVGKIRELDPLRAKHAGQRPDLLMRQLQEIVEPAQFVQHLHGRGMYRITPEIAQKIGVFLKDRDTHARARENDPEHHAGGTAAGNTNLDGLLHRANLHPKTGFPQLRDDAIFLL